MTKERYEYDWYFVFHQWAFLIFGSRKLPLYMWTNMTRRFVFPHLWFEGKQKCGCWWRNNLFTYAGRFLDKMLQCFEAAAKVTFDYDWNKYIGSHLYFSGQARLDEEDSNGCFKNLGAKCRSYKIMKKTTTRRCSAQNSQFRLGPLNAAVSPPVKKMFF